MRDPDKPEKYIGSDENWEKAESAIREVAESKNLETVVEYGEAAFYGPKLDFMVRDAIGRTWQLGTVQIDYNLPERFELEYIGSDNVKHRPVMIHRAPFGSMERFVAILIEHCAGKFPLWLSPVQIVVATVTSGADEYAKNVAELLGSKGLRVETDLRNEKINYKIREHSADKKVPIIAVVGMKEVENNKLALRRLGSRQLEIIDLKDALKNIPIEALPPDMR